MKKPKKLKDALKREFSEKEISFVNRAFDTIGDIAIIEIPEELFSKEKIIGETLLSLHKNINVVCKKTGIHKGTFRTQDLKVIAGENRKETTHKENGVVLKLDVEKVYYSPRSSTERKRLAQQVSLGEDVLVMFSGCGPFVCAIAKNTDARMVYGIELNPVGHKYAKDNIHLNKISNALVVCGDVLEKVPKFYQSMLGLKSSIKDPDLKSRMTYCPDILEIHTFVSDFLEDFDKLRKKIKELSKKGIRIMLHQPMPKDNSLDVVSFNVLEPTYKKMISLVKEFNVDIVIHFNTSKKKDLDKRILFKNILSFKKYYHKIFFENGNYTYPLNSSEIIEIIKETGVKNVCIDTCHLLHHMNSSKMLSEIKEIQKYSNTYFHLSDYKYEVHAGKIDSESIIDLKQVLPEVTFGVCEVKSQDEKKAKEMIDSWKYLSNFNKKFDRILMPLPKSAEDFLDVAIPALKEGGVLHFYDFLEESKFFEAHDKIKRACNKLSRKFEILDTVKCGQFGPKIFRICVDVRIN